MGVRGRGQKWQTRASLPLRTWEASVSVPHQKPASAAAQARVASAFSGLGAVKGNIREGLGGPTREGKRREVWSSGDATDFNLGVYSWWLNTNEPLDHFTCII